MHLLYLLSLCFVIVCLFLTDYRYKLGFWKDRKRTIWSLLPATIVFIMWDFAGISEKVFFPGHSKITTRLLLAPKFPIEEVFFLFILSYSTLIVYRGMSDYANVHINR